jgi:3-hydroxyisobutyrate dehydrogenase
MQKVALLGLGIMGGGMAANLLKGGFALSVYNRTRERAEPFAAQGAQIADTPRQAAQDADVILAMVGDDDASRAVWLGDDGALANVKTGATLIECSTLTPEWVRELAMQAAAKGCKFLDAPVTGSKAAAANGQLTLLVGGDAETLEAVLPVLEAISSRIAHIGPTGAGATYKLINNMMAAVHVAALGEGLALAERAGLNIEALMPLINDSAINSLVVKGKLPRMVAHNYDDTDFALKWMHKDVRYALGLGSTFDVPLKTAQAAFDVIQAAREKGFDDMDFAATAEGVRK